MNDQYEFAGQKEDEKVILVVRQHPWVYFTVGLQILAVIILYLIFFLYFKFSWLPLWGTIGALVLIVYFITRAWFIWWNKVYILTSDRVIAVDQKGWFDKTVGESTLENILFINHEVKGPIKTMLNFGDVRIRASGVVEDELVLANVFNPYDVQQEIVKAQKEKTGNTGASQESNNRREGKVVLR